MTLGPSSDPDGPVLALGLMSGTSLDGIDAALIRTDGSDRVTPLGHLTHPYAETLRERLRACLGREARDAAIDAVERELTQAHAVAVGALLQRDGVDAASVRAIGFHGHTILHRPGCGLTWQLGDAALLAGETGIDVVADFRSADVAAGGQGAPLAPAFHRAIAADLEKPVAMLNVGGVANVTWIGADGSMIAFDTGPGNALIDDWMRQRTGSAADEDGRTAAAGQVDDTVLSSMLADPYLDLPPPKSLDRLDFDPTPAAALSTEDGAATLTAFTAAAVARAVAHLPEPPRRWLVCGGGRHNPVLMQMLAVRLAGAVEPIESIGWDGDALEAQAFAYLAIRSIEGLPVSWPGTTGAPAPLSGGRLFPS